MTNALLANLPLSVINVGVDAFMRSVRETGGTASALEWRPVGDGDPALAWALAQLASDASDTDDSEDADTVSARIDRANAQAVERIVSSRPMQIGRASCRERV